MTVLLYSTSIVNLSFVRQVIFFTIYQVVSVAWNPGTEQPLRVHPEDVDDFFRAYKKLHRITVDKSLQVAFPHV